MAAPGKPLHNILWLVGERATRAAVTATVLGRVARYLQPAGFGHLNFVITTAAIAATLANLGLEGLVVSALVRRPAQAGAVLGTAFRLRLAAGAVTALLLVAAGALLPNWREDAPLLGIIALALLFQPAEVIDLWFQRHLDSRRTVVVRLAVVLAGAALKLWLVASRAPLPVFVWAQVAEAGFFALGLGWSYRSNPHVAGPWRWDPAIAREFWRLGAPLALSGAVVALSLRLDQLQVHAYLDSHELGVYFSAARLTEIALLVGTTMTVSFFPALADSHARQSPDFNGRLQALFDALSALGWLVAIAFSLLGPTMLRLLYGPSYLDAAAVLALQGWACVFALSASARWQFILLAAPTTLNLAAAALSIGVQLALGGWLVPHYGVRGAALTWLVAAVASGFLTSFLFPPLRACAPAQARALLIPFAPGRWRGVAALFSA